MSTLGWPLVSLLILWPIACGAVVPWILDAGRARAFALSSAIVSLALAAVALVAYDPSQLAAQLVDHGPRLLGVRWHFGIDGVNVLLVPLTAGIAAAVLASGAKPGLTRAVLGALLVTEGCTIGALTALDLGWLVFFWIAALLPAYVLLRLHRSLEERSRGSRTFLIFRIGGAIPLIVSVAILGWLRRGRTEPLDLVAMASDGVPVGWQQTVFVLMLATAAIRMALVPFHSWLPAFVEKGPLGVATLVVGVHSGLALFARVVLPLFPEAAARDLPTLVPLALVSALYGAVLALVQTDLRRALGALTVSQSGMILVGICSMNTQSVSGALLQSIATGASITGLLLVAWAIEERTGTTDVRRLGGLARTSPRLASVFFLFAVGAVGFPGSLGFVSEDFLLHGVLEEHPIVASLVLLATALNGITVVRLFTQTFGGGYAIGADHRALARVEDMLRRERLVAVALLVLVFGAGVLPGPLIAARTAVVKSLVTHDAHHAIGGDQDVD